MGLREKKAQRTHHQIVDAALELFRVQGYEQTTIEQIAEKAEVGTSTLYRYFPSKDLILLDRMSELRTLGPALRARPAHEPLDRALTEVLLESLDALYDDPQMAEIRGIIDNAPIPRARLWDVLAIAQDELESALAERLGRPRTEPVVMLTASTVLQIHRIASENWMAGDHATTRSSVLNDLLSNLHRTPPILPSPVQ